MLTEVLDRLVAESPRKRELAPRELLFRQGDKAEHVFAVETGRVKLARYLRSGKSVVMHVARAGHSFTEAALLSDVYHCNAIADIRTRVRMYRKKDILRAIRGDPDLALAYVASLSGEVQRLRMQLELHSIQSARERILKFLLLEADPDSLEYKVQISLKDVATGLGLAHETFYRELARLESDHVITRNGDIIGIKKEPLV